MDEREWIARFAEALGRPAPADEEVERVLRLAAVAAHASARPAAPVACWLAGAAGVDLARAQDIAAGIGGDPAA